MFPPATPLDRFKGLVFTLVGVGLMLGALAWADATRRFVAGAARAPGVVVRLRAGGAHPQVRFVTAAGRAVEYPQNGMVWTEVGERVAVLYDPANPTGSAVIDRFGALWGFTIMDFLLGAGFVLMAQLARRRPDLVQG